MRKAKIVCTIGPSSNSRHVIFSLIRNGMDVARLNFSHGNHEGHRKAIEYIREGARTYKRPVAILQDLQGIKIRVGLVKNGSATLKRGDSVRILKGEGLSDEKNIFISYPGIIRDAKKGDRVLLDDGLIHLKIESKSRNFLKAKVLEGGILKDRKGVNLPFRISAPSFTEKDAADLDFGLKMGVDYVALSFVRTAKDIKRVRDRLKERNASVQLIAKIEKHEAISNIDGILEKADGIMIARGDLGVEIPPEEVPVLQKRLIELSNKKGKVVITATQMLESMTEHTRPTRAEATDVANAVIDGTDALMLSGETAVGKHPVEVLRMMDRIITFTEVESSAKIPSINRRGCLSSLQHLHNIFDHNLRDLLFSEAVAGAACTTAGAIGAKFIIAFTHSGFTASLVSKFRPTTPIIAFTSDEDVMRRMAIYWGVYPWLMKPLTGTDEMIKAVEESLLKNKRVKAGDRIVITASTPIPGAGKTNLLKLHTIGEGAED